jgi:hypothetical protein
VLFLYKTLLLLLLLCDQVATVSIPAVVSVSVAVAICGTERFSQQAARGARSLRARRERGQVRRQERSGERTHSSRTGTARTPRRTASSRSHPRCASRDRRSPRRTRPARCDRSRSTRRARPSPSTSSSPAPARTPCSWRWWRTPGGPRWPHGPLVSPCSVRLCSELTVETNRSSNSLAAKCQPLPDSWGTKERCKSNVSLGCSCSARCQRSARQEPQHHTACQHAHSNPPPTTTAALAVPRRPSPLILGPWTGSPPPQ